MESLRPGAALKKGDVLFKVVNPRFGDRETAAQSQTLANLVETLQGELSAAQESLLLLGAARDRSARMYRSQLVARAQMEEDETRLKIGQRLVESKSAQLVRCQARAREMAAQLDLQKESVVCLPVDGVVWSVAGKMGEQFEANKPVLEIINPARLWVDAFFPERFAEALRPGLKASISPVDGSSSWSGELQSVRAGVGRLAYDTTVAVPPPELAKRQVAVRVGGDWKQPYGASEFYGVGRSVQVAFGDRAARERTIADALQERFSRLLGGKIAATDHPKP
jgi:multidrug resistance efflux pump